MIYQWVIRCYARYVITRDAELVLISSSWYSIEKRHGFLISLSYAISDISEWSRILSVSFSAESATLSSRKVTE